MLRHEPYHQHFASVADDLLYALTYTLHKPKGTKTDNRRPPHPTVTTHLHVISLRRRTTVFG